MTRAYASLLFSAVLFALHGCAKTSDDPGSSSGSNWLACERLDDCDDDRATSCSEDGYCLDADGDHIAAAGSPSTGGRSSSGAPSGSERVDSGVPAVSDRPNMAEDAGPGEPSDAAGIVITGPPGSCVGPGVRDPLVARANETCYQFLLHEQSSPTDTTPFAIPPGESYTQTYYAVPWPAGSLASAYGVELDNPGSTIHAWLFSTEVANASGTVSRNVLGTLLGENARMLAPWAIGGCNVVLPDDVGLELPDSGNLVVQWHHFNTNSEPLDEGSRFTVCTVPAEDREQMAGITMLGTEYLGVPAGATSSVSGACVNDSGAPVTLVALDPHMHRFGVRATTAIERVDSTVETVLDVPFVFDQRQHYMLSPRPIVRPGDTVRATCTVANDSEQTVDFGQSALQEMCFQFAVAYPPIALDNGVISLVGALNTCW